MFFLVLSLYFILPVILGAFFYYQSEIVIFKKDLQEVFSCSASFYNLCLVFSIVGFLVSAILFHFFSLVSLLVVVMFAGVSSFFSIGMIVAYIYSEKVFKVFGSLFVLVSGSVGYVLTSYIDALSGVEISIITGLGSEYFSEARALIFSLYFIFFVFVASYVACFFMYFVFASKVVRQTIDIAGGNGKRGCKYRKSGYDFLMRGVSGGRIYRRLSLKNRLSEFSNILHFASFGLALTIFFVYVFNLYGSKKFSDFVIRTVVYYSYNGAHSCTNLEKYNDKKILVRYLKRDEVSIAFEGEDRKYEFFKEHCIQKKYKQETKRIKEIDS